MATIKQLAEQMSKAFETKTRTTTGEGFRALKYDAPEWMLKVCQDAHGDMLADDWRYVFIEKAVDAIAEFEGEEGFEGDAVDSIEPSIYTHELTGWLHSRADRIEWMDRATEDYGQFDGIFEHLQAAQGMEADETFGQVLEALLALATP